MKFEQQFETDQMQTNPFATNFEVMRGVTLILMFKNRPKSLA